MPIRQNARGGGERFPVSAVRLLLPEQEDPRLVRGECRLAFAVVKRDFRLGEEIAGGFGRGQRERRLDGRGVDGDQHNFARWKQRSARDERAEGRFPAPDMATGDEWDVEAFNLGVNAGEQRPEARAFRRQEAVAHYG